MPPSPQAITLILLAFLILFLRWAKFYRLTKDNSGRKDRIRQTIVMDRRTHITCMCKIIFLLYNDYQKREQHRDNIIAMPLSIKSI